METDQQLFSIYDLWPWTQVATNSKSFNIDLLQILIHGDR